MGHMTVEPPHGTTARYRWRRDPCHCEPCKKANTDAQRERRRRLGVKELQRKGHGTRACYNRGCQRPECVQANRDYAREYARLRRSGLGVSDPWVEDALR